MSAAPSIISGDSPTAPQWHSGHNPWAIALTVTLATFMEVLDTSIANVALPHIAGGLSASVDESTWVLTSYLVSNAIVLPASAWASTLLGRKRFYMGCVALFTVSSCLCGIAPSLSTLILCRVLQGAGGGGLQPSEQGILADTFAPERRGMAFAVYGMAVVLAPAIGPTLGGWITDNYNWRWIFFINVPVGVISLLLSYRMIEDPPYLKDARKRAFMEGMRIDYVGLMLLVLIFGPLQVMLDKGEEDGWFQSHFIVALAVITVVALVAGIIWELYHDRPIIHLRLLKRRNFAISCVLMLSLGVVLYGTTTMLPEFVQVMMGYTAERAGMMISPGGLVILLLMPIIGALLARVDARWLIATGMTISALAMYHMTGMDLQMSFGHAMMLRVYQSVGLAFLFVPINTLAYVGMPAEANNQVSAIINLMRNIGGSVGISLLSAAVTERAQIHQDTLVMHTTMYDSSLRDNLSGLGDSLAHRGFSTADAAHQATARIYQMVQAQARTVAYLDVFWILMVLCAAMVPLVFLMKRSRPGGEIHAH
jgi:MFS transporter, DHA2 family, multidrug resistance protein